MYIIILLDNNQWTAVPTDRNVIFMHTINICVQYKICNINAEYYITYFSLKKIYRQCYINQKIKLPGGQWPPYDVLNNIVTTNKTQIKEKQANVYSIFGTVITKCSNYKLY